MSKVKNTALGKMKATISNRSTSSGTRSDLRPSKEGLMSAPSTVVQLHGRGYDNPDLQHARNAVKGMALPRQPTTGFTMGKGNLNNVTDYRCVGMAPRNSIKRLNSISKKRSL